MGWSRPNVQVTKLMWIMSDIEAAIFIVIVVVMVAAGDGGGGVICRYVTARA